MSKNNSVALLLLWLLTAAVRHLKTISIFVFVCTSTSIVYVLLATQTFSSESLIFIPNDSKSKGMTSALKEMSGIGDMMNLKLPNSESNSDLIMIILSSKELYDHILRDFNYPKREKMDTTVPSWYASALKLLKRNLEYEINDDNGLKITFKDTNALLAQKVNQRVIEIIDSTYSNVMHSRNRESRIFYEQRLNIADSTLKAAQQKLFNFEKVHKIIAPDVQIEQTIKVLSELETKASMLRINKSIHDKQFGSNSLDVDSYTSALGSTEKEINRHNTGSRNSLELGFNKFDKLSEYYELLREFKIQESVYKVIRQDFEEKILDENKNIKNIVVIQKPWVNHKRVSPPRSVIVFTVFCMSILLSLCWAVFIEEFNKYYADSQEFRQSWIVLLSTLRKSLSRSQKHLH